VPDLEPLRAIAQHLVRHDQRADGAHERERRTRAEEMMSAWS